MSSALLPASLLRVSSARAMLSLAVLSVLFFQVTSASFASLGVVLPDMVAEGRWSWSEAGLGFTILGVACGLASFAPALVIRGLGVRATLVSGAVLSAAGLVGLHWSRGVGALWAGAALVGIGYALAAIIPGAYVLAQRFERPARALGAYYTIGQLGAVAGPWLYAASRALTHDWRPYWLVQAVAVLVLGGLAAAVVGEVAPTAPLPASPDAPSKAGSDWTVRAALATPQFWIIAAAFTTYLLEETTVSGVSVAHLAGRGVAASTAGAMLSLQALLNAFGRAGGGFAIERVGAKRLAVAALLLTGVGIAALSEARGYPLMLTYAAGVGIGYGLSFLAATVLLLDYFGRARNLELFSILCAISTLAALGPFLGGLAKDRLGGFEPALWVYAALAFGSAGLVAAMKPPVGAFSAV